MELNVAYNVVYANSGRERETQATQENIAYDVDERSPTQTDEDNEYSTTENIGEKIHIMDGKSAYTAGEKYSTNSILDNKSNTRQGLAKNECAKKRFAILATTAFVLSLLVAVAALVYTNMIIRHDVTLRIHRTPTAILILKKCTKFISS